MNGTITDVPGIQVGHAQDEDALTGCTVLLCSEGAVGGVDQRGGAPGTRETDLLRPMHLVERVHAVLLTGGSAFGLDAAGGVMRYLEEQGMGFDVGVARVPIVPAAVLFDLGLGSASVRPDAAMGYRACQHASHAPVPEGNVGAGCGATVGKALGMGQATKSGLGSASIAIYGELVVGALVAVNAFGDIMDPSNGQIIAGTRSLNPNAHSSDRPGEFADSLKLMQSFAAQLVNQPAGGPVASPPASTSNTVIAVVASNARLSKEETNKVAQMAQDGLARAVRPAHTLWDGDTIFALSTGTISADVSLIGALAAEALSQAILRAVRSARPAGGLPAAGK